MLDPCEDDNEVNNDDSVSLGADSVENDDASDSGSEVRLILFLVCLIYADKMSYIVIYFEIFQASSSQEDQYIVQPIGIAKLSHLYSTLSRLYSTRLCHV